MGRKQIDSKSCRFPNLIVIVLGFISCSMIYMFSSAAFRPTVETSLTAEAGQLTVREERECCRGIDRLELWGDAVRWGADFKVNSSEECCRACKEMCEDEGGQCLCDSWVYCGNRESCGTKFGECWLKKQKDTLDPVQRDSGDNVMWTSGLILGKGQGIVGLKTDFGVLRIQLYPDCAPYSVNYILELLASHHCIGCQFHRAESRGSSWDSRGNHIQNAPFGPPFGLIQGTLEAHGAEFKKIPREECLPMRRGSVAWVGSGPEFFISLANHHEWRKPYTTFGSVLPEDMEVAEKIAQLPTKKDSWSNVSVLVLEKPVSIRFQRI